MYQPKAEKAGRKPIHFNAPTKQNELTKTVAASITILSQYQMAQGPHDYEICRNKQANTKGNGTHFCISMVFM